jgi:excisionase family DNA binding protein
MEPDRLLSLEEVGRLVGWRKSKIYNLIRDGELHALKLGKSSRVSQREVLRFVRESSTPMKTGEFRTPKGAFGRP